jgi:hypothetical protein
MDAWINQIAFVMKYMIVPLVESQIETALCAHKDTAGTTFGHGRAANP